MNTQFNDDQNPKIFDFPTSAAPQAPRRLFAPRFAPALDPDTLRTALEAVVGQLEAKAAEQNLTAIFTDEFGDLIPELADTPLGETYYELYDQLNAAEWRDLATPWVKRGLFVTLGLGVGYLGYRYAQRRGWTTQVSNRLRGLINRPAADLLRRLIDDMLKHCVQKGDEVTIIVPEADQDTAEAYSGVLTKVLWRRDIYLFRGEAVQDQPVQFFFHRLDVQNVNAFFSPAEGEKATFTVGRIELLMTDEPQAAPDQPEVIEPKGKKKPTKQPA
jgi:hypothetical protein